MSTFFQIFTFTGAVIAILTGAFTLWDRHSKGRPVASLNFTARADGTQEYTELSPKLVISNFTDFAIFIFKISVSPAIYFLPKDHEIRSLVKAQLQHPQYITIGANESLELLIATKIERGMPLDLKKRSVRFIIHWRRGDAPSMPRTPICLCANSEFVSRMSKRGDFI